MMLQEHIHKEKKINFDIKNLPTPIKVNLLHLCDMIPSSNMTQISMQHGNRKAIRLQKQFLDSFDNRLIKKTASRQRCRLSRLPHTQAAGPTTQANRGGNIAFTRQNNRSLSMRITQVLHRCRAAGLMATCGHRMAHGPRQALVPTRNLGMVPAAARGPIRVKGRIRNNLVDQTSQGALPSRGNLLFYSHRYHHCT